MKFSISYLIVLIVFCFCLPGSSKGQEKTINGMVTTFDSIPLINASIKLKGTKNELFTDTLGKFSVTCKPGDKLLVSAKGFNSYRVSIDEKTKYVFVNLQLRPGKENVEYAIGYGHVKDKDKLHAISSLKSDDMDFSIYQNMFELIKGRFPGVTVENGQIIIRGIKSINSSNAALIVIDGVIMDESALSSISPNDVESIDVLKDASAAIYGARGANGVVLVETKRGGSKYQK